MNKEYEVEKIIEHSIFFEENQKGITITLPAKVLRKILPKNDIQEFTEELINAISQLLQSRRQQSPFQL